MHGTMTNCQQNVPSSGTEVREETEIGFRMRKVALKHASTHQDLQNVTSTSKRKNIYKHNLTDVFKS